MKEGKGRSFRRTLDSELLTKAFLEPNLKLT